jgi:hypothetical protein
MSEEIREEAAASIPVWREALANREHELYKAAWTVFLARMDVAVAGERLSEQKATVIPFLQSLLQDKYLYTKEAPGAGIAPANAARLLGQWKVRDVLPELFAIIETGVKTQPVYNAATEALYALGTEVVDDVLAWAEENPTVRDDAVHILGRIAAGNEKAFETMLSWFQPGDFNLEHIIEHLIDVDAERAISALYALSTNRDFSKEERNMFREKQKEARRIAKQKKKQQIEEPEKEAIAAE